ncbi:MAG: rRNA pseudouridine synthase [Deltaproteobacteria bacterium]|nr:rRNA pseudouridine synthase [Deltaproteobacteria bacterium]
MPLTRLQKYLSQAGICSRREAEKDILNGFVKINGAVVSKLGVKVEVDKDKVEYKGMPAVITKKMLYLALNKPDGYISACKDKRGKTVLDLIKIKERIFPVGRLDKDSCGLILFTNDGSIHHRLLHPSFDHEKEYEVTVKKPITNFHLLKMEKGVVINGVKTREAKTEKISNNSFSITLKEGRNRQIRRMADALGYKVVKLKRIRFANILLNGLQEGSWRYLTKNEIKNLI